ncbi:MAG: VWA domain-containing protein [Thermoanaerobaculia bacterium]
MRPLFDNAIRRAICCLVLLALASAAPAQTQTSATEDPGPIAPFLEVVDVEIVNVDVWVTDKKGNPVDGLTQADFEVFRDGQPVEVTNFFSVAGGRPAVVAPGDSETPAETPSIPKLPLPGAETVAEVAPEHQLWLIIYIDNYNIDPIERNRILPSLELFLHRALRAGGRTMLVSYDGSLKLRQPFTDEARLLLDALAEFKDDAGQASIRRRDQMAALRRIDDAEEPSQALLYARQYAEELVNGVESTVEALERMIETLAGLPGRKALVHVSSGVPMLAGEEMFHAVAETFDVSEPYAEIPRHDTSRSFARVTRQANAHRVAFHTLDAGGLRGFEFGAAEYAGFVNTKIRSTLDSIVPENLQAGLRFMADETGGRAILNRNEILPALEEVTRDFASFYSLGIASTDAESGRYHEIKVKLAGGTKGRRLRHRAGYRSKNQQTRIRESLQSALLYSHQTNPLEVDVAWGQPQPHSSKNYLLPIRVKVPLEDVVLLPVGEGKHEARLQLFVGAAAQGGDLSDIEVAPMGVRLADEHVEAAKKESLVHTHKLLVGPGRQKVGVAILDVFGSQSSVVTGFIQVGPDKGAAGGH